MPADILHITSESSWGQAVAEGEYRGDTLATQGFIHFCTTEQMAGVQDRYYRGQTGLLVLRIDPGRLSSPLKWETLPGSGEKFPHLYGPLNLDAVVETAPLEAVLTR